MSRIAELVASLCPDGVPYLRMRDMTKRQPKTKNSVGKIKQLAEENEVGEKIIAFTSGKQNYKVLATHATVDGENIFINDGGAADAKYHNGKATYSDHVFVITSDSETIETKYIYYLLKNQENYINEYLFQGSGLKNLKKNEFLDLKIPVPPLEVQREIVHILNSFTNLEAELEAEHEARKKQYGYYRDELLSEAGDTSMNLSDVTDFQNGFAFKSSRFKNKGEAILRITNVLDGRVDTEKVVYFDTADYKEKLDRYKAFQGDVLIAMSGATTGKVGALESSEPYYVNQRVGRFLPNDNVINKRYLFHFLASKKEYLYSLAGGGAQPNLSTESIKSIPINPPSITRQAEIARILDNLHTLATDISVGIPAEIAARRKQYEYYRNKLLTFEELPA